MTFPRELEDRLRDCTTRVPMALSTGQSLEEVLNSHLLAVEAGAGNVLLTSILLLDATGKRLWHAAAPSLPQPYCEAINGAEIGPNAGSCGTAAFKGRAIYVADIATDPLWEDYRDLALPHGLQACWSTPIYREDVLLGTFAVYHSTPRRPTRDEVKAISLITGHVANAIHAFRGSQDLAKSAVSKDQPQRQKEPVFETQGLGSVDRSVEDRNILNSIEADFVKVVRMIGQMIEAFPQAHLETLTRAKRAAERGAELARMASERR